MSHLDNSTTETVAKSSIQQGEPFLKKGNDRTRRIIVSGLPRSGTSWVAKALSFAPGFTYYREPDNYDHVEGAYPYFNNLYLPAGEDDPCYHQHMTHALNGQIATPFTMSQNPGPLLGRLPRKWSDYLGHQFPLLYLRQPHCLVKLVRSNLALEWLSEHFPDARQVHVLRHPCGVFASWQRHGWEPEPIKLLDNERLVQEHLWPYTTIIQEAQSFWERAGALWGSIYKVIEAQLAGHPSWVLVEHEWLCQDPVANFQTLYGMLDLAWNDQVQSSLKSLNQPPKNRSPYSLKRQASQEIDKWKRQLRSEEVAECRQVIEKFKVGFYSDFEPASANPKRLVE